MIRQVLMDENILMNNDPNTATEKRGVRVRYAPARRGGRGAAVDERDGDRTGFRIVIDELLIGNSLEEVECRGIVDDDIFDRVPIEATPDDIARCSALDDVLPRTCTPSTHGDLHLQERRGLRRARPTSSPSASRSGSRTSTRTAARTTRGSSRAPSASRCDGDHRRADQPRRQLLEPVGRSEQAGARVASTRSARRSCSRRTGPMPTNSNCQLDVRERGRRQAEHPVCAPPDGDVDQTARRANSARSRSTASRCSSRRSRSSDGRPARRRRSACSSCTANANCCSADEHRRSNITMTAERHAVHRVHRDARRCRRSLEISFTGLARRERRRTSSPSR